MIDNKKEHYLKRSQERRFYDVMRKELKEYKDLLDRFYLSGRDDFEQVHIIQLQGELLNYGLGNNCLELIAEILRQVEREYLLRDVFNSVNEKEKVKA